ncbi:MAG: response regulator [Phycisphaerae bacterium]
MRRPKDVLTTGEVAKICNVAPRTVSKWFDSGKLRGYRIPGSKDRRIPMQQLVRFMRAHGIPINGLDTGVTRVLIVEQDQDMGELLSKALVQEAGYDVQVVRTAFEAGAAAEAEKPHVLLVDISLHGFNGRDSLRAIRNVPDMGFCKVIAVTQPLWEGEEIGLKQQGYDAILQKPFEVSQAVQAIESALGAAAVG